ncbi:TonB-dependent receptor [Marivirga sp. S37H4]|uniref:TonB-dependent receptor n=1 Tax=Marivirga aurantiaca TaxID=2802615 RepID=A0A935CBQ1_9BACT|nr:TonB-dependent receptor [Marivirga aurantiaca]MBK6267280.1 TonB-dependent receptor [Marivirga aurantiaca]
MKNKFLLIFFLLYASLASIALSQEVQVSGKVVDDTGEGLPGVNVIIKNQQRKGTVTDLDGNYSLSAQKGDVLVFSFVGFSNTEITVGNQSTIDVEMIMDIASLSEVVVVGYGTQVKREITGSISKVDSEDINEFPTPSFEAALQGRAAGVQVVQGSGLAGSGSVIRVRGISSVSAGGDPLYVIDGVPVTQDQFILGNGGAGAMNYNPLSTINPNDIESVEILKDASAAGIYGSRGANGVVLVTTKKGKSGKPTFNFSSNVGIAEMAFKPDMLSASEYIQLRQEAWENDGNTGRVELPDGISWEDALANNTDWVDATTQTGVNQEYNLSGNWGTRKFKTYIGLSYTDNESFLIGNAFERMSGRANLEYKPLENLSFSLNQSVAQGINNRVNLFEGSLGAALSEANPIYPIFTTIDGEQEYYNPIDDANGWGNPVFVRDFLDWTTTEKRSLTNLNIAFEPINNLKINFSGGFDYLDLNDQRIVNEGFNPNNDFDVSNNNINYIRNFTYNLTAGYDFKFSEKSKLNVLIGNEFQKSITDNRTRNSTDTTIFTAQNTSNWAFLSYFTRASYSLNDKYFFQGTARLDASSRFGENNRFGFFPSLSGAWIISEEDFMSDVTFLSFLKLKASWGLTGNSTFPDFQRFGNFQIGQGGQVYNGEPTVFPTRLANPDLRWEKTRTIDFAIETGFANDRITTEIAYYNKVTTDVIINVGTQPGTGFNNFWDNIGRIDNSGVELSLTSRNLVGDFTWTTTINAARNENEVKDIGGYSPDAVGGGFNDTRVVPGQPVGANFLVRFSRVDPDTGKPIWLDKDGNETFNFDLSNRVVVGSVIPDLVGGISNKFAYKNFDLNVFFTYTVGGNIYDGSAKRQLPSEVTSWNFRGDIVNRWQQPGDIAQLPKLTLEPIQGADGGDVWQYNSTLFLYDASYLRLRSLSLGYNLPSSLVQRYNLNNVRISFTGSNLLTFTKYPGDPEIARDFQNAQDRNLSPNVSFLTPPQQRAYMLGLNIGF